MMATVPHVTAWAGRTKYHADGFLFNWVYTHTYTECLGGNAPDFERMFLKLKYTDITKNTYIRSSTVTEMMVKEVWNHDSCYTLIDYQIHIKTGRNMWFP